METLQHKTYGQKVAFFEAFLCNQLNEEAGYDLSIWRRANTALFGVDTPPNRIRLLLQEHETDLLAIDAILGAVSRIYGVDLSHIIPDIATETNEKLMRKLPLKRT